MKDYKERSLAYNIFFKVRFSIGESPIFSMFQIADTIVASGFVNFSLYLMAKIMEKYYSSSDILKISLFHVVKPNVFLAIFAGLYTFKMVSYISEPEDKED